MKIAQRIGQIALLSGFGLAMVFSNALPAQAGGIWANNGKPGVEGGIWANNGKPGVEATLALVALKF